MTDLSAPPSKRQRLFVDLPGETQSTFRRIAERYFHGVSSDAARSAIALLTWALQAREAGKTVVAVPADDLPARYEAPTLPEQPPSEWHWLVARPHPWRRQLWVKGRKLVAGDVARSVEIAGWSPEQAALELDLPVEAVVETLRYLSLNRALVEAEEAENRIAAYAAAATTQRL